MEAATALALNSPSTPLANQVGGHQGVMADASGSLVIKPALAREIAFYQLLNESSRSQPLHKLKAFLPRFFGTLRLEGQMQGDGTLKADIPEKAEVPESIVIENLSHGFIHPNILDVKLGTVLHEPSATEEKKARMEKQAKETTTRETGIRLTGFQTWHAPTASYIVTPKSFGKSITGEQLPVGMQRFFPLPNDVLDSIIPVPAPSALPPTPVTASNAAEYLGTAPAPNTAGGIASAASSLGHAPPVLLAPAPNTSSLTSGHASGVKGIGQTYTDHAIPPRLLSRVLDLVNAQLEQLEAVLAKLEIRFVGGSVLIVYEADVARLEAAFDRWDAKVPKFASDQPDVNGEMDDDEDLGMSDLSDEDSDDDNDNDNDDDDDDGRKEDERLARKTPPVRVKMIDFAHTWLAQGEGPDQGVLLGFKTLRGLIRARKAEIMAAGKA